MYRAIDVSAQHRAAIQKYNLGGSVIYDSAAREKYADKTKAHLEATRDHTSLFASPARQVMGLAKTFGHLGMAAVNAAVSALALRIIVDSLMKGVHVEGASMEEILVAEEALKEAKVNLEGIIATAESFDGSEQTL